MQLAIENFCNLFKKKANREESYKDLNLSNYQLNIMKKNFLKSLSIGVASLSLIASCAMIKGKCESGKCEKNKCSSKSDEANKCSAAKTEETNKCSSTHTCSAKKDEAKETHKCASNSCASKKAKK